MHTSEPVIFSSSIDSNGIRAGNRSAGTRGLNLIMLILILLNLLCVALALLIEFLVLGLDFGLAVL